MVQGYYEMGGGGGQFTKRNALDLTRLLRGGLLNFGGQVPFGPYATVERGGGGGVTCGGWVTLYLQVARLSASHVSQIDCVYICTVRRVRWVQN